MLTEQTETYAYGQLRKVTNVLCADGVQRTATVTGPADTFFSVPARVKANGKTVSGFLSRGDICVRCGVSHVDHDYRTPEGGWNFGAGRCADGERMGEIRDVVTFTAYKYRKNADAIRSVDNAE